MRKFCDKIIILGVTYMIINDDWEKNYLMTADKRKLYIYKAYLIIFESEKNVVNSNVA